MSLLVAFFHSAASFPEGKVYLSLFPSIYAAPFVIIFFESAQEDNPRVVRRSGLACLAITPLLGAGFIIPIWIAGSSIKATPGKATGNKEPMRAIAPAFALSFFGLSAAMANEGGWGYLSPHDSSAASAAWQAFPL